jgi:hypothetical protein
MERKAMNNLSEVWPSENDDGYVDSLEDSRSSVV